MIYFFICLKGKVAEREGETDLPLIALVQSPKDCNSQAWGRPKPESQELLPVLHYQEVELQVEHSVPVWDIRPLSES